MAELLDRCTIIRVQSWTIPAEPPVVGGFLEGPWPLRTGSQLRGAVEVLCLGPTEWLVMTSNPEHSTDLTERLSAALQEGSFRATDMSSALARFRLMGPNSRALLSKGSGLDLHRESFRPHQCARTRLAAMPVVIRCMGEDAFECLVTASFQDYLSQWLVDAAFEFDQERELTRGMGLGPA